jgi:hypothetical protein
MKNVIKCSDCAFFANGRHPQQGRPCSELGFTTFAKACDLYQPNTIKMLENVDVLQAVSKLTKKMSVGDTRILSWLINNISSLNKRGYSFGQTMYVNLSSPYIDYVNCWYKANLVNVITVKDSDGVEFEYLQLVSSIASDYHTLLTFPPSIVLNADDYKKHKATLEKNKLVTIPCEKEGNTIEFKLNQPLNKPHLLMDIGDVPTIDTVPDAWLDNRRITEWIDPLEPVITKKKKPAVTPEDDAPARPAKKKTRDTDDSFTVSFGKHN